MVFKNGAGEVKDRLVVNERRRKEDKKEMNKKIRQVGRKGRPVAKS